MYICFDQDGDTALLLACREGYTEVVRLLLIFSGPQSGTDTGTGTGHINLQGDSPIIVASRENHMDIVRLLIVGGADINCCNKVHYVFRIILNYIYRAFMLMLNCFN